MKIPNLVYAGWLAGWLVVLGDGRVWSLALGAAADAPVVVVVVVVVIVVVLLLHPLTTKHTHNWVCVRLYVLAWMGTSFQMWI